MVFTPNKRSWIRTLIVRIVLQCVRILHASGGKKEGERGRDEGSTIQIKCAIIKWNCRCFCCCRCLAVYLFFGCNTGKHFSTHTCIRTRNIILHARTHAHTQIKGDTHTQIPTHLLLLLLLLLTFSVHAEPNFRKLKFIISSSFILLLLLLLLFVLYLTQFFFSIPYVVNVYS